MTPSEATDLALRMKQHWPAGGPASIVWEEVFTPMEAGRAGTTIVRLRNTEDRCPSIAKFQAAYALIQTETSHPYHRPVCPTCDGTMWRDAAGRDSGGNPYVVRCDQCVNGRLTPGSTGRDDTPADPAFVDALLAERGRRAAEGLLDGDWADEMLRQWRRGHARTGPMAAPPRLTDRYGDDWQDR